MDSEKIRKKSEGKIRKKKCEFWNCAFYCIFGRASGQSLKSSKKLQKEKWGKCKKKKKKKLPEVACFGFLLVCMFAVFCMFLAQGFWGCAFWVHLFVVVFASCWFTLIFNDKISISIWIHVPTCQTIVAFLMLAADYSTNSSWQGSSIQKTIREGICTHQFRINVPMLKGSKKATIARRIIHVTPSP